MKLRAVALVKFESLKCIFQNKEEEGEEQC